MVNLRFILCLFIFSDIGGETCALNGDLSDIDSSSIENNNIDNKADRNSSEKITSEEYNLGKDYETYEQLSAENKAESELYNSTKEFRKNMTDKSSLEDGDIIKEDSNNRIDDDMEPTTDMSAYLNKATRLNTFMPVLDKVVKSLSNKFVLVNHSHIAKPIRRVPLHHFQNVTSEEERLSRRTIKSINLGAPGRMFFKNCRNRDADDLCRNTLIDYPYAVSIQNKGAHYATGTLLDKRWILTVAGEFYFVRESIKFFRARLGAVNCKRGGILVPLQEVNIHPLFVPHKPGFDLALLRMGQPVEYSQFITPIRLSAITERVLSAKFMTMYWPRLIVKGTLLPPQARERTKSNSMRVSTQRLIGWQYCHKMMLETNEHLEETSLCLKPLVTHHSLCLPDPGAPIVADDGLWGVTSGWTSTLCHSLPGPTIFTRISSPLVRTWLDSLLLGL